MEAPPIVLIRTEYIRPNGQVHSVGKMQKDKKYSLIGLNLVGFISILGVKSSVVSELRLCRLLKKSNRYQKKIYWLLS